MTALTWQEMARAIDANGMPTYHNIDGVWVLPVYPSDDKATEGERDD